MEGSEEEIILGKKGEKFNFEKDTGLDIKWCTSSTKLMNIDGIKDFVKRNML